MADSNVKTGANVGFLTGSQDKVDTMLAAGTSANAKHGYFYLAKDSHRLYVGNEDGSLSAVNEGVQTYASLSELETKVSTSNADTKKALTGRFFYLTAENILCVYNGQNWVQINANSDSTVTSNAFTVDAKDDTATITQKIENSGGSAPTRSFSITGAGGVKITEGTSTKDSNSNDVENITITGDTYTLSADQPSGSANVDIKLDSTNTESDSKITLVAGTYTTLTNNNGEITIEGRGITEDSVTIANAATNGFTVTVADSSGASDSATYDPQIRYGQYTGDDVTKNSVAHLNKGIADLNVYTKTETDDLLKALNAMEYRGTVGTGGTAVNASTGASIGSSWSTVIAAPQKIGYTYMFITETTIGEKTYSVGTLAIARGTEGTDGYITSGTLTWDFVESTTDTDTTSKLISAQGVKSFTLQESTGASTGTVLFAEGTNIEITVDNVELDGSNKTKTFTVSHKDVERKDTSTAATIVSTNHEETQGTTSSITIPAITSVSTDSNGHVTAVNTVNYTLTDTNGSIDELAGSTSVTANKATLKTTITATNSSGGDIVASGKGTASITVGSDSLTITNETGNNGININMTWGSF